MRGNLANSKAWPSRSVLLVTILVLAITSVWLLFTANNLSNQLALTKLQLEFEKKQALTQKLSLPVTTTTSHVVIPPPPSPPRSSPENMVMVPETVSKLKTMGAIGGRTGTDKITTHRYHRYYPRFVEELRYRPSMKMLEIGFLLGQSFEMWKEYFPNGKVYFMDINREKSFPEARFVGNGGKVEDLEKLLEVKNLKNDLDLIIDDGSHYPPHQLTSFEYLFVHGLKPGGVYIIEDIETSYWQSGECYGYDMVYGRDHPDALVTRMKPFVDVVNRKFSLPTNPAQSLFGPSVDKWIAGIFFGTNTIVIMKTSEKDFAIDNADDYHLKENLKKENERSVPVKRPKNAPPGLRKNE